MPAGDQGSDEEMAMTTKAQGWRKRQIADKQDENMSIEAMKQALEVLEDFVDDPRCQKQIDDASIALRQAIEQAEKQEPACPYCHDSHTLGAVYYDQNCVGCVKRMTATPQPQREWVGLTRSECLQIEKDMMKYYDYQHECKTVCLPEFARAIEAKLKEKNT